MTRQNLNSSLKSYLKSKGIEAIEVCLTNTSFSIMVASECFVDKIKNLFANIKEQIKVEKNEMIIDGIEFEKWDGKYFVDLPLNIQF